MFGVGRSETLDPLAFRRGEADGSQPHQNEATCLHANLSGEHVVQGGKYNGLVTEVECARARIPDAPLPPPSQGTRLRVSGVSRFLLPTFLCGRQRKVGARPAQGRR